MWVTRGWLQERGSFAKPEWWWGRRRGTPRGVKGVREIIGYIPTTVGCYVLWVQKSPNFNTGIIRTTSTAETNHSRLANSTAITRSKLEFSNGLQIWQRKHLKHQHET